MGNYKTNLARLCIIPFLIISLTACENSSTEPPKTALGLYTGQIQPSKEYLVAKDKFKKWKDEIETSSQLDYQPSTDISDYPSSFRPYLYKSPQYGYYDFTPPSLISVYIKTLASDGSFQAFSISAGYQHLISGKWHKADYGLQLVGKELGTNTERLVDMQLITKEHKLVVNLKPLTKGQGAQNFTLLKTDFKYDPNTPVELDFAANDDALPFDKNPSVDILEVEDVENLTQPQIKIVRNLIFARHGYTFANKDLRVIFEGFNWYMPRSNDVKSELTNIEIKNIALLKRYEKYADSHYDYFGR